MHTDKFIGLQDQMEGDLFFDDLHRAIYATDASVYRELPTAVAYPKTKEDIQMLILFAKAHKITLIPRSGGTSIAGQCVGDGIVIDVSRYLDSIIDFDMENKTITVEPGIIRDELNRYVVPYGLFFSPNTSTSNRCTLGGMVGNNSSGTTSIKYGVTRDKILEIEGVMSNGETVTFKPLSEEELKEKITLENLEGKIYRTLIQILSKYNIQSKIKKYYPKQSIHRRNTGYAIDSLLEMSPFKNGGASFNLCPLLAGSEGTLIFTTKIKLKLDNSPPPHRLMVYPHFHSIYDCCSSVNLLTKNSNLYTCEMIDDVILECSKNNSIQAKNRDFIAGNPKAILMLELRSNSEEDLEEQKHNLLQTIEKQNLSYATPVLYGKEADKGEELRRAGLGLLSNVKGDKKGVPCIEDTAVALEDFSNYISDFENLLKKYHQKAVFYAHAGAGELHLRPILNLKTQQDISLFRKITHEVAKLVKSYNGALSGEHGDGRVRSEFLEMMVGKTIYKVFRNIKETFDTHNIFNAGKIVDAPPMDKQLRYQPDRQEPNIKTVLDFSDTMGILRAAEQCNGSSDCRKTHLSTGMMCPSYHATKNEKDTTRARSNILREFLTHSSKQNKFDHKELKAALDLCISCKACKQECPSNVDMAALKIEFLYQYKKSNGYSLRDKLFAFNYPINQITSKIPPLMALLKNKRASRLTKRFLKISQNRELPTIKKFSPRDIYKTSLKNKKKVLLFVDEFSMYVDSHITKDAFDLLLSLGYDVDYFEGDSGRAMLSVGYLKQARHLAEKNCKTVSDDKWKNLPILGIEPSTILTFRDEYPRLVLDKKKANQIKNRVFLIEEFLAQEISNGNIDKSVFHLDEKRLKIHVHCHQKSLSNQKTTFDILNFPENYNATIMNTGCCGMAGGFGYHEEHYQVSMDIANLSLLPKVKNSEKDTIIVANGTSCRQQIYDGTGITALHPISVLKQAII